MTAIKTLTISTLVALLLSACGSSSSTSCSDLSGNYTLTYSGTVSCTDGSVTVSETFSDTDTYTATQSQCSLTMTDSDGDVTALSVSGNTMSGSYSETDIDDDGDTFSATGNQSITINGSSASGSANMTINYDNELVCTSNTISITGTKN